MTVSSSVATMRRSIWLSAALIRGFPLNEQRHGEIRRALAARDAAGLFSDPARERWLADDDSQGPDRA